MINLSTVATNFIQSHGVYSSRDIMRHRFFIYLALITIAITTAIGVILVVLRPPLFFGPYLLTFILAFSAASLWIYRRQGLLEPATNMLLAGFCGALVIATISVLNAYKINTYFYMGTPILAYFIAGKASGRFWTALCTAVFLVIAVVNTKIQQLDIGLNPVANEHAFNIERSLYLGSMLTFAIGCYLYTYLFYRYRKVLLKQQESLRYIIDHDELTGVYNSKKITEIAGNIIDSTEENKSFSYTLLDINNFKELNDLRGYTFGDQLLTQLAKTFEALAPSNSIFARINGARFALITTTDNLADAQAQIEALTKAAWNKVIVEQTEVTISSSFGTAIYPADGDNLKTITGLADKRMLERKIGLPH